MSGVYFSREHALSVLDDGYTHALKDSLDGYHYKIDKSKRMFFPRGSKYVVRAHVVRKYRQGLAFMSGEDYRLMTARFAALSETAGIPIVNAWDSLVKNPAGASLSRLGTFSVPEAFLAMNSHGSIVGYSFEASKNSKLHASNRSYLYVPNVFVKDSVTDYFGVFTAQVLSVEAGSVAYVKLTSSGRVIQVQAGVNRVFQGAVVPGCRIEFSLSREEYDRALQGDVIFIEDRVILSDAL